MNHDLDIRAHTHGTDCCTWTTEVVSSDYVVCVCGQVAWLDVNSVPLTYEDRRVIDDTRFSIVKAHVNQWNLQVRQVYHLQVRQVCHVQVRQVRRDDAGRYRCTVNTFPVRSKVVYLHVKGDRFLIIRAILGLGGYTTESVTHGRCDVRPTVTFPAAEHCYCPNDLGRYSFPVALRVGG